MKNICDRQASKMVPRCAAPVRYMPGIIPWIRLCSMAQTTLRKGDYLGELHPITSLLKAKSSLWLLTGGAVRGLKHEKHMPHHCSWLKDWGGHMVRNYHVGGLQELRVTLAGWQPERKWEPITLQSSNSKELNPAKPKNELGSRLFSEGSGWELSFVNTLISALWCPEQRAQPHRGGLLT